MSVQNPHDRFFKRTFGEPETAIDFLENYLPPTVLQYLDLDTLALVDTTLVDEDLAEHQSDLLYAVQTLNGTEGFIYLLFEHKSYPDKWVNLQLLRYMVKLWQQEVEEQQVEELRPILPIVIYHGEKVWPFAADFQAYFSDEVEMMRPFLPEFKMLLKDFSALSAEEIRGTLRLQAILLALRRILDRNLATEFEGFIHAIFRLTNSSDHGQGLRLLELIVYYFTQATEKVDVVDMRRVLTLQGTAGENVMKTIA